MPKRRRLFYKAELEPRLAEAREGKRTLMWVDASHFVLASFLGYVWCFVRKFVKAASGRQRFNLLGALNARTHELITEINTAYINAESVCALLRKVARVRPQKGVMQIWKDDSIGGL